MRIFACVSCSTGSQVLARAIEPAPRQAGNQGELLDRRKTSPGGSKSDDLLPSGLPDTIEQSPFVPSRRLNIQTKWLDAILGPRHHPLRKRRLEATHRRK